MPQINCTHLLTRISLLWMVLVSTSCIGTSIQLEKFPNAGYRYVELVTDETFDSRGDWRTYDGGESLNMTVKDGVYHIDLSKKQFVWTQAPIEQANVVIEATIKQNSEFLYANYGVICRANPTNNGRGYYFLISGDGYYTIRWGNGATLDDIVRATPSNAIKRNGAGNRIRAVCVDDYLALWINDTFVAEARANKSSSGEVGLAAMLAYEGQSLSVDFDDVKVWKSEYLAKSSG